MRHNFLIFLLIAWSFVFQAQAQSVYIPLNRDYYHLIDRFEIKSGQLDNRLHTQLKPFHRKTVARLADSTWTNLPGLSPVDKFNLDYLKNDNWEWSSTAKSDSKKPLFKSLYKKKSDAFNYQDKTFDLHVNPVFYGYVGRDSDIDETPILNTRGLEIRGHIGKKIGFYSFATDNQATFPGYVTEQVNTLNAVPNEGFFKRTGNDGLDFLTARGYITFDIIDEVIDLQFGYDKNFIGNGFRSMILSDFSSNYLYVRMNTRVWKLHYQNVFAQLTAEKRDADGFFPQKYYAHHHLSMNIGKKLNIGLFESIIFNRGDSTATNDSGDFDLRYLNPIIFYRSVEQQAGSPDNAILGMDFKWNFLNRFSLYGQLVIDEFVLSRIRDWDGWRGNKQSGQIGIKYIDVAGISNLDLQAEVNIARPYIYSHNFLFGEFSNYNQQLVHPLGANFYELVGVLRYQPTKRLNMTGIMIYADYGTDSDGRNYGQNIFLDNSTFEREIGNNIGQGVATRLLFLDFTASWQIRHNFFVDFKQIYRRLNSALDARDRTTVFTSIALRLNIAQRNYEF